jgi:uncharacterized protein (DUF2147 family)
MNGPQHYREAERLGRTAKAIDDTAAALVAAQLATAHATLALAAATALNDNDSQGGGMPLADYRAWRDTAGLPIPKCSQCDNEVQPGRAYCSTACRNADDRHDTGEVSA